MPETIRYIAPCHFCGELHLAEYSHPGRWGEGPIWAAYCDRDDVTDYYTREGVELRDGTPVPAELPTAAELGLQLPGEAIEDALCGQQWVGGEAEGQVCVCTLPRGHEGGHSCPCGSGLDR